jgi:hypothetical protein
MINLEAPPPWAAEAVAAGPRIAPAFVDCAILPEPVEGGELTLLVPDQAAQADQGWLLTLLGLARGIAAAADFRAPIGFAVRSADLNGLAVARARCIPVDREWARTGGGAVHLPPVGVGPSKLTTQLIAQLSGGWFAPGEPEAMGGLGELVVWPFTVVAGRPNAPLVGRGALLRSSWDDKLVPTLGSGLATELVVRVPGGDSFALAAVSVAEMVEA